MAACATNAGSLVGLQGRARRALRLAFGDKRSALRARLAEAQGWRCCWCGKRMTDETKGPDRATFEHVKPRSCGGSWDIANLVIACADCNNRRGHGDERLMRIRATIAREEATARPRAANAGKPETS